jgi:hypothetical protein
MGQRKRTRHRPPWEQSEDDLPPGAGRRTAAARYRARLPRRAPLDIEEEEYAYSEKTSARLIQKSLKPLPACNGAGATSGKSALAAVTKLEPGRP